MSNFTLVVINGENLNIYKQDTFSETIKKIVELKESYENFDIDGSDTKWILYEGDKVLASKGVE